MKVLIISINQPDKWYEITRLVDEFKKKHITADHLYYENWDLLVDSSGDCVFFYKGEKVDLSQYTFAYLRSSVKGSVGHTEFKHVLINHLVSNGVRVLNGKSLMSLMHFPKLIQHYMLSTANIPTMKTYFLAGTPRQDFPPMYPLIVKKGLSSQGKDVFKAESRRSLLKIVSNYKTPELIYQPWISGGVDYRVLVLDRIAVGVMKRVAKNGSHLSNISAGATGEYIKMNKELKDLSEKAASIFDLDFCGVDVIYSKGKPVVLEVNRIPQFGGFEQTTGINVAKMLVEYMISTR